MFLSLYILQNQFLSVFNFIQAELDLYKNTFVTVTTSSQKMHKQSEPFVILEVLFPTVESGYIAFLIEFSNS